MAVPHFLTLLDLDTETLLRLIQRGIELKRMQQAGEVHEPLRNRVLTMVFEKSSTRTRVSFEAGMAQLGGHAIFLSPRDTQLGRGEPVADTARVLSGMTDAIMVRTFGHDVLKEFADNASVPVINGLSDLYHPCQLLADIQAYWEHRGDIQGKTVAWLGDGNNMCHSYINAARQFDFQLNVASPAAFQPRADIVAAAGARVRLTESPLEAAADADLIVTDVWASMGQEDDKATRHQEMQPYQVNADIMAAAKPDALFMHCLPAHRGEEVTADVIDGPQSVVWDEAHNRLHAQKALLEYLLIQA